jgi:hypothetical protein
VVADHPSEGKRHVPDRTLGLGVELQVIEHELAHGDSEGGIVTEGVDGLPHRGDCLGVEPGHIILVERSGVGRDHHGMPNPVAVVADQGEVDPIHEAPRPANGGRDAEPSPALAVTPSSLRDGRLSTTP